MQLVSDSIQYYKDPTNKLAESKYKFNGTVILGMSKVILKSFFRLNSDDESPGYRKSANEYYSEAPENTALLLNK